MASFSEEKLHPFRMGAETLRSAPPHFDSVRLAARINANKSSPFSLRNLEFVECSIQVAFESRPLSAADSYPFGGRGHIMPGLLQWAAGAGA
jgi:hypothetical protein